MCGIAGRFHPDHLPADPYWHKLADARLLHRGPDGSGHYLDDRCELVHRRLALIDLSPTGHQPMPNEDESVYVIFNGEIYNHRRLRDDLHARGHMFRGTSDTEVLVHLYEEHGPQMVERLRGMFAFAVYDRRRRRLLLARDRFGIKPLYYAIRNSQCVFASEIKAILPLADFKPSLDRQACYDYLGLGYIPDPATGFEEIKALPRASVLLLTAAGNQLTQFYQTDAQPQLDQDFPQAVDSVSDSLLRAVHDQMVADVPVAALLSGGIDSSLVVAAYSQVSTESPRTFNVRFPDPDYDETAVAQAASTRYHTRHETIDLRDWAMSPDLVLGLLAHFDQPFADTSLIPMYWIARAIRERGIICALSGDGGDEAFGGYARFWRANRLVQLMRLPAWVQAATVLTGHHLSRWTRDWGRQIAKAMELAQEGQRDSAPLIAGLSNYLSEKQKSELLRTGACEGLQPVYRHFVGPNPPAARTLEELSRRMTENLFDVALPGDMLRKVDMMSMLASIEVRVPMLDEEMVAVGLRLPHRLKTDGQHGKLVLRGLAERWLPRQVVAHPKHGFDIPLDRLVTERFHEILGDMLLSPGARIRGFLDVAVVERWLAAFKKAGQGFATGTISRGGLYQRIIILLALELWMREHQLSW